MQPTTAPEPLGSFRDATHAKGNGVERSPKPRRADVENEANFRNEANGHGSTSWVRLSLGSRCRNRQTRSSQRFLSVIPTPAPSIRTNDVSSAGFVVIASM